MRKYLIATLLLVFSFVEYSFGQELPVRPTIIDRGVELSWTAPIAREDGSQLLPGELDGYELYALCSDQQPLTAIIPDETTTSFSWIPLPPGECTFSIATFDTDGLYSEWSETVTVTLKSNRGPKRTVLSILQRLFGLK